MSANEKPSFAEILAARGADAGLKFTEQQLEQFTKYYELLVETNKVMNLTALTEPEEVAVKHMIDSLLAYDEDMAGKTLADVGTGAGFPGVPLKIYCPELKVTLIDSLGKRLRFLQQVIDTLGLKYIRCEHLRAEDAGKNSKHPRISPVVQDAVAEEISEAIYAEPLQTESQHHEARGVEPLNIDSLNLENLSRQMIEKALERNGGNRKKAAQELGISDRTLYRKIKQLKIK